MCSLCAVLGSSRHWTDAAGRPEFERAGHKVTRREERERRVAFLNHIIFSYGLSLQDWGGNSYVLQNRHGKTENVYNLAGIWAAAERLAERACDPLDADLIARLEGRRGVRS